MERSAVINRCIRRLFRQSQKYSVSRMENPELTPSELKFLRHIGFHGEVSQRHLAEEMDVDKAMVSRMLQSLESRGYLVRREDEHDARSKKVLALPPTIEIYKQSRGLSEEFFDRLLQELSPEEAKVLEQALLKMAEKAVTLNGKGEARP